MALVKQHVQEEGRTEAIQSARIPHSADRDLTSLQEELRLAGEVQRAMLPNPMPRMEGLSIDVLFRPADYVSGDIYAACRLDETHLGLALADVTGHGLPAALMTFFLKRGLRGREVANGQARLCLPDEVLRRLNAELLEANLDYCPYATAAYATYDRLSHRVSWARGGLPFPILVRPGRVAVQVRSQGSLLGAFEGAEFETASIDLGVGDGVIFATDGLEALLAYEESRLRHDDVSQTPWFGTLGHRPLRESLAEIERRLEEAAPGSWPADDVTVLALTRRF